MPQQYYKVQRPGLTYAQMEGAGIWKDFTKWVKGAAKKTDKTLKKTKAISRVGGLVGPLIGAVRPGAGAVITSAAKYVGQHGYGGTLAGGRMRPVKRNVKNLSPAQVRCMQMGYGAQMGSGGVSLAMARKMGYPKVKNITAAQVKQLKMGLGKYLPSGAISLKGGAYGAGLSDAVPHAKRYPMKRKPKQYHGEGVFLAGQRGSGRRKVLKKRLYRRPVSAVLRY